MLTGVKTDSFYRALLDNLSDGVYFVDTDRNITYWNKGAEAISGYSSSDVVGRSCKDNLLTHTDASGCQLCFGSCPLVATFQDGTNRTAEVFLKHKSGHRVPVVVRVSPIVDEAGCIIGGVETFSDNSSKLAAVERASELEKLAYLDPLTGVGNRRYTEQILQQSANQSERECGAYAVLFIDLDRFKTVNDTYGHDAGDAVLRAVAQTLMNSLRSYDFVGRWGGEEFLAVLSKTDADRVQRIAQRCCSLVRSCAVEWAGESIQPTISIGTAIAGPHEPVEQLIARADLNLYRAKEAGRNRVIGP